MKTTKRYLALVLAVVLSMACMAIPAMASGTQKFVTTGSVNMRKGAGLNYGTICSIGKNVTLTATDYSKDNRGVYWVYVKYNGKTGWVSAANLKKSGSGTTTKNKVKATDGDTYVRNNPNLNGKKLVVLNEGAVATYLGKKSKDNRGVYWYKVSYKGKTGWVSSRYTTLY